MPDAGTIYFDPWTTPGWTSTATIAYDTTVTSSGSPAESMYQEYIQAMRPQENPDEQDGKITRAVKQLVHSGYTTMEIYANGRDYWFYMDGIVVAAIENGVIHVWRHITRQRDRVLEVFRELAKREGYTMGKAKERYDLADPVQLDHIEWPNLKEIDDSYLFEGVKLYQKPKKTYRDEQLSDFYRRLTEVPF